MCSGRGGSGVCGLTASVPLLPSVRLLWRGGICRQARSCSAPTVPTGPRRRTCTLLEQCSCACFQGRKPLSFRDPRSGTLLFRGPRLHECPARRGTSPAPCQPDQPQTASSRILCRAPILAKCSTFTSLMWVRAIAGRAVVGTDRSGEGVRRTLLVAEAGARSSCSVGHCTSADRPRRVAAKQCRCCKRADDAGAKACGHTGRNQRRRRHAARGRIA